MGTLNLSFLGNGVKTGWTIFVLLVSGIFALITAVLVAWPALAYIASRFFQ